MSIHPLLKVPTLLERLARYVYNRKPERQEKLRELNRLPFTALHRLPYVLTFKTQGTFTISAGVVGSITVRVIPVNRNVATTVVDAMYNEHIDESKSDESKVAWVGVTNHSSELLMYDISGNLLNDRDARIRYYPAYEWNLYKVIDYSKVEDNYLKTMVYQNGKLTNIRTDYPQITEEG